PAGEWNKPAEIRYIELAVAVHEKGIIEGRLIETAFDSRAVAFVDFMVYEHYSRILRGKLLDYLACAVSRAIVDHNNFVFWETSVEVRKALRNCVRDIFFFVVRRKYYG